jgi:hypothetical protein
LVQLVRKPRFKAQLQARVQRARSVLRSHLRKALRRVLAASPQRAGRLQKASPLARARRPRSALASSRRLVLLQAQALLVRSVLRLRLHRVLPLASVRCKLCRNRSGLRLGLARQVPLVLQLPLPKALLQVSVRSKRSQDHCRLVLPQAQVLRAQSVRRLPVLKVLPLALARFKPNRNRSGLRLVQVQQLLLAIRSRLRKASPLASEVPSRRAGRPREALPRASARRVLLARASSRLSALLLASAQSLRLVLGHRPRKVLPLAPAPRVRLAGPRSPGSATVLVSA